MNKCMLQSIINSLRNAIYFIEKILRIELKRQSNVRLMLLNKQEVKTQTNLSLTRKGKVLSFSRSANFLNERSLKVSNHDMKTYIQHLSG